MSGVTRQAMGLLVVVLTTTVGSAFAQAPVDLQLRRGLYEANLDRTLEALWHLETPAAASVTQRERAEFLLAHLLMGAGGDSSMPASHQGFAAWQRWQALLQALAQERSLQGTPTRSPGADLLLAHTYLAAGDAAGALAILQAGDPPKELRAWWWSSRALAEQAAGVDPTASLDRVLAQDDAGELGHAAAIRRATLAASRQQDPTPWLKDIPESSLVAARALHMLAKLDFERGDLEAARQRLETVAGEWPHYADRRDVALTLGAIALEQERFEDAWTIHESLRGDHERRVAEFRRLQSEDPGAVWSIWEDGTAGLELGGTGWNAGLDTAVDAALDLRASAPRQPVAPTPTLRPQAPSAIDLQRPTPEQWAADRDLAARLRNARYRWTRSEFEAAREAEQLARQRRLKSRGEAELLAEQERLLASVAKLDSMVAIVDAVVAQLHDVRDRELLRIAERTRQLLEHGRQNLYGASNMQDFYIRGPMGRAKRPWPEEVPTPARLLDEESVLVGMFEHFLQTFATRVPEVIAQSSAQIWEPRLRGSAPRLAQEAHRQLDANTAMLDSVRADLQWAASSAGLEAARAASLAWQATIDSLTSRRDQLRQQIVDDALVRTLAALAAVREGIDYGCAAASYELGLTEVDLTDSPRRGIAIAELRTFLDRYPESVTRGESRFRLADLLLVDARAQFHTRMQAYLAARDRGENAVVPYVDTSEPVALYEAILTEDPGFAHRDAALFHAGMILADESDPRGESYLATLLDEYPESELGQRTRVRIADLRFEAGSFAGAIAHYQAASLGAEPTLTAIALYKLGWCHLNSEDNDAAIDAFRRLLDLYEAAEILTEVDLRSEAEDDLIHALSRAGGARRFAQYFDSIGTRSYETRILIGMSQLMRSYALHGEATATDELFLTRYPEHADALAAAERLVDTHQRWSTSQEAYATRLRLADRFLAGTAWWGANQDAELRARATEFSRGAYRAVALFHHKEAREHDRQSDYVRAAELYDKILSRWPQDGEAPRFHLLAGEALGQLDRYAESIEHYGAAALSDTASFRRDALWQTVALTDRWYESTRPDDASVGADSLATRLIRVGRTFAAAYPGDEQVANLRWREGNLAFAHARYQDAVQSLTAMQAQHPQDERLSRAATLRGQSLVHLKSYALASDAYEDAWRLTPTTESVEREKLRGLIPHCDYLHAESVAAQDSTTGEAAALFVDLARKWPAFEHADRALYRGGLGYAAAQQPELAVQSWESLLTDHPQSSFARDAHLQIASTWENAQQPLAAARAFETYSAAYPDADDADDAMLKASDLRRAGGDHRGAEDLMTAYLDRFPGDVDTAVEVRETRAIQELDSLGGSPVSALLGAGQASDLAAFLTLAEKHPEKADGRVLGRVRFLQAEELREGYVALRLTQPLDRSLEKKKGALEGLLAAYGKCVATSVTPWAQASAFRIGEAMVLFGDALNASEAPADLGGDDLLAYREVLEEQSWEFFDRGEQAWTELLQESAQIEDEDGRAWIARTREALFPRVASRFLHRPEVEYPVVPAPAPAGVSR